jgi:hypothetical protein
MVKNLICAAVAVALSWSCVTASVASNRPDAKRFVLEGVSYDFLRKEVLLQDEGGGESAHLLFIIHKPRTGLTWWGSASRAELPGFQPEFPERLLTSPTNVGVSGDRIAVFSADPAPTAIFVDESRARFKTLADAERALSSPRMKDREGYRSTRVNLREHLGNDFRIPLGGGHVPRPITIPRVRRTENDQWLITLRGPNGDFADVTLTDEYELVDVRRYR